MKHGIGPKYGLGLPSSCSLYLHIFLEYRFRGESKLSVYPCFLCFAFIELIGALSSPIASSFSSRVLCSVVYFVAIMILVVVSVTVIICGGVCAETVSTQPIHQRMNDLRN